MASVFCLFLADIIAMLLKAYEANTDLELNSSPTENLATEENMLPLFNYKTSQYSNAPVETVV